MGICGSSQDNYEAKRSNMAKNVPKKNTKRNYELLRRLGEGAAGTAIRSKHKETGDDVVVKEMLPANKNLFVSEWFIHSQLGEHDHIARFRDAYRDETNMAYYIVTEYCRGGDVFDVIVKGRFSERKAAEVVHQTLQALRVMHKLNMAHRDLKPENLVCVSKDDVLPVKLIDFGVAVQATDDAVIPDCVGSLFYMAPEVTPMRGNLSAATWRAADMWSIGVIAYLFTHGKCPFSGRTRAQCTTRIARGKFKVNPALKLSEEFSNFVTRLLQVDPKKRMTVDEALAHPWVSKSSEVASDEPLPVEVVESLRNFRQHCRLKKAVARVMANRQLDDDKEELGEVFKLFDTNGDGRLGVDEIAAMMAHIGSDPNDAQALLEEFDADGDGHIDPAELATIKAADNLADEEAAKSAFQHFDADGSGMVDPNEVAELCSFLDPAAVAEIFASADKDGNGRIDMDEWMEVMRQLNDPERLRQLTDKQQKGE